MKIRFEKIKALSNNEIKLPIKATKHSAGYDFYALSDTIIKPHEVVLVPTGVKAIFPSSVVLLIFSRSSLFLKHNLLLTNGVGVIDSDYAGSENDGHIMFPLYNLGTTDTIIKQGERVCQGIFIKTKQIKKANIISNTRLGGFGSTSK